MGRDAGRGVRLQHHQVGSVQVRRRVPVRAARLHCVRQDGRGDEDPGQLFSGAYYHKVSSTMQVGAEIKKAASKSDVDLAFGCLYKLDKSTTVKGKVDSDGKLLASFKQQLSPRTLLTLVSEVDTVNLNEGKHKFGMSMSLTP